MSKNIFIPIMSFPLPPKARELPITQRENLTLALRHEKPKWMPIIGESSQWFFPDSVKESPPGGPHGGSGYDWFGTFHKMIEGEFSALPVPGMFDEIGEWREKVKWPDLDAIDWREGIEGLQRDPNLMLATRFAYSCFERLHSFEGFEQCLCDVLLEPEECKAFFDRVADLRIDTIRRIQDVYNFDIIINHDDWANAKAQFFSLDVFEETLLEPSIRIAEAVHETGAFYMPHCCGKMDVFVPYFVNELHADSIEIQTINDVRAILDNYGGKITPVYHTDPYIMFDPDTTVEQARAHARDIVDKFGAHTCDGAGIILNVSGGFDETYYALVDEIYNYSGDKYASI